MRSLWWLMARWRLALTALLLFLGVADAAAQAPPARQLDVPPALEPWVGWVMHEQRERACAQQGDTWACEWPGALTLDATATGGRFTLEVWRDTPGHVMLPGGAPFWPQAVTRASFATREPDRTTAPLVQRGDVVVYELNGAPAAWLDAGRHVIQGELLWRAMPELVQLPTHIGLITLRLDGREVERPRFDDQGRLWISESGESQAGEADGLRVSVYRRISDGVPLQVTTLLELNVSGRAREVKLGAVLLPDSRPVAVRGPLPVQLDAQGQLSVYMRPGTHRVELDAMLTRPVESLTVPARPSPAFEAQEVWLWRSDEALRSVELSGLVPIDPARTSLPAEWRGTTTLLAEPGQQLSLRVTRRGQEGATPNQLTLARELWLDLDGRGYTIRDSLAGKLAQGWRLEHAGPGALGRVTSTDRQEDLLITQLQAQGHQGVELRDAQVGLSAELRLEDALSKVPVVGWAHDVQALSATLHLPPGWTLLGASGVDQVTHTWIDSWRLFDIFLLLMVALAMGRLFGWPWGVVGALTMTLCHGQPDAPRLIWFVLLGLAALLRVLPKAHWVHRVAVGVFVLSFVWLIASFGYYARHQVRVALHPQVASPHDGAFGASPYGASQVSPSSFAMLHEQEQAPMAPSPELMEQAEDKSAYTSSRTVLGSLDRKRAVQSNVQYMQKAKLLQQIDPSEVVQTGPGLPTWSWRVWTLRWNGPVTAGHEVRLWLLSPLWSGLWRLMSVLLLIAMGLLLLNPKRLARREGFDLLAWSRGALKPLATLALVSVAALCLTPAPSAHAQATPDPALLETLRERLIQADTCHGECVVASAMTLRVEGQQVTIEAQVSVQRTGRWTLPGPLSALAIREVLVDGVPTRRLLRDSGGMLAVRLEPGTHQLLARGLLSARDVVTLQLDAHAKPRRVTLESAQWSMDGTDTFDRPDDSLQLTRAVTQAREVDTQGARELPPWYSVSRELTLSLPWQTRTTVRRDDSERPQLVKIPLLAGESVISEGVRVEGGEALVEFARGSAEVSYLSELVISPSLTLTAPEGKPFSEVWSLECTRIWRCEHEGLAPISTVNAQGQYAPQWRPWPGESITLQINKPQGAPGAASTVTRVDYRVTPGDRLLRGELSMTVRASQGGWQRVTLPAGATLYEAKLGGEVRNLQSRDGEVVVPLTPGEQEVSLLWQQPSQGGLFDRFPTVKLGSEAVNVSMIMTFERRRWLLWAWGPAWGATVLFWSHLALMLLIGALLGQLRALPMRPYQWLLLAVGLSQLGVLAFLPIVAWLSLLTLRQHRPWSHPLAFNGYQLALLISTLVAAAVLYSAVHTNLLYDVNMQVRGADSSNTQLRWYVDRVADETPDASLLSVPLLVWRAVMLAWALWLVALVLRLVPWAWRAFGQTGYWRRMTRAAGQPMPPQAQPVGAGADGEVGAASAASAGAPDAADAAPPKASPDGDAP